jgi:prophage regulatory protein
MPASASRPVSLLRLPAVIERTGLSKTEIYRRIKAGAFPAHSKLSPKVTVWASDEIDAWVAARIPRTPVAAEIADLL